MCGVRGNSGLAVITMESGMTEKTKVKPPTQAEYEKRRLQILLSYAPRTYPCGSCGWPVIDGYCCNTCGDTNPREKRGNDYDG